MQNFILAQSSQWPEYYLYAGVFLAGTLFSLCGHWFFSRWPRVTWSALVLTIAASVYLFSVFYKIHALVPFAKVVLAPPVLPYVLLFLAGIILTNKLVRKKSEE